MTSNKFIIRIRSINQFEKVFGKFESIWLSFEYNNEVIQTCKFNSSSTFVPQSTELIWSEGSILVLFVCTVDRIIGSIEVDIDSFLTKGSTCVPIKLKETSFDFCEEIPSINLSVEPSNTSKDQANVDKNKVSETSIDTKCTNPLLQSLPVHAENDIRQVQIVLKQLNAARMDLERKQHDWKSYREQEEYKFRKHLKSKERKVRAYLEQQILHQAEEHKKTLDVCKTEYKTLESRLKKSLRDIEAKERDFKRQLETKTSEFERKIVESKRMVEVEASKTQMVQSKVKLLQVDLQASQEKCLELENNLHMEKKSYESSDIGKFENEIKTLKSKVMELEMNLNKEISEKSHISAECDRYRNAAQNLAKIVKEHQIQAIANTVTSADCLKTQTSSKMKKRNNKNNDRLKKMEQIKSQLSNLSLSGG